MAGVRIELNQADLNVIQSQLYTLANITDNLKPVLNEIGDYLVSETTQRFKDSTAPDDTQWQEVKRGGQPLVNHGHLRDSITYDADNDSVEISSNLVYAAIHQLGCQAGRGHSVNITARPFLGVNMTDEREIGDILVKHISRQLQ